MNITLLHLNLQSIILINNQKPSYSNPKKYQHCPFTLLIDSKLLIIMSFTQYNSTMRSSKNLFRERSISGLPSRQGSVMNIINQRESSLLQEKAKFESERSVMLHKDNQISKLRKNLQTAVSTALYEKLENSKNKDELNQFSHLKKYLEGKIKQLEKELKGEKENTNVFRVKSQEQGLVIEELQKERVSLETQIKRKGEALDAVKGLPQEMEALRLRLKDIDPLKQRIMVLQENVRHEKLLRSNAENKLANYEEQIEGLQKLLATSKPREQQLRERIAYFQRVNLDLSRKMEDYNRRQNDYIKQITTLKQTLTKTTAERNLFKVLSEETANKLEKKTEECVELGEENERRLAIIKNLQIDLETEKRAVSDLKQDIQGKNQYYKRQGEENVMLRQKNQLLQAQEFQLRRVIAAHIRVADEVNLTITANVEQLHKLKVMNEYIKAQLSKCQQKFDQFDKLIQQGSQKGISQIRDSYYVLMRSNNDLSALVKEQRMAFDEKVLVFGQQRQSLLRNSQVRKMEPPTDETQLQSIFYQKSEAMLLLEKSNDQLLQVKKQLQGRIEELLAEIEREKKEMNVLKLKTADLFKAKKELEEAKKTIQRYQDMVQEEHQAVEDAKSQISVLRQRNADLNEKNFMAELDRRNLEVKVKELGEVMKELNLQTLMSHKQTNEKNTHLLTDSLQKLDSAVKSLAFFFHCAFCHELPVTPVTLALCGHTYCVKCKQAYAQSCYQCDTGQPIQKVFQNRFLKDAGGKYKFLTMVLAELRANFNKKE